MHFSTAFEACISPLTTVSCFKDQRVVPVRCCDSMDKLINWMVMTCTVIDCCTGGSDAQFFTQGTEALFLRSVVKLFDGQLGEDVTHIAQLGVVFSYDSHQMIIAGH